ncbi:MAG: TonB-dependent receptor [Bacteroidales bacterium]|nr:TonB-dependent receptor [Bacteroidales bacterium]
MRQYIFTFILILLSAVTLTAQTEKSIYGYVTDGKTGETLPNATIMIHGTTNAVTTNSYGYYSIPGASIGDTLLVYYVGYQQTQAAVTESRMDIRMMPLEIALNEVTVASESVFKRELAQPRMSHHHIAATELSKITPLFGNTDAIKTLQLLPGVNSAADGGTNLSVRGGSYDQNTILLDEATVYNPAHALGLFSAMNTDAVSSIDFYKGAAPAKYGGKLSSVIDMRMKEGNKQEFHGSASVGTMESRLVLEGPIVKDKASFMISGRKGYGILAKKALDLIDLDNNHSRDDVNFSDYCGKLNWTINDANKLYVSAYYSKDKFKYALLRQDNKHTWGNKTGTLRWNHIFDDNRFSNLTLTFSDYDYVQRQERDRRRFNWEAGMQEWCAKYDIDSYSKNGSHLTYGGRLEYHHYRPGEIVPSSPESTIAPMKIGEKDMLVAGLYFGDEFKLRERLSLNAGMNVTLSSTLGGKSKSYINAEPRISASYAVTDNMSLKASYAHTAQYQHLLNNSALGLPTDIWAPADSKIKPQQADQVSVGIHSTIKEGYGFLSGIEWSAEVYAKLMHNIIDFKEGTNFILNPHLEEDVLRGRGRAAGFEAMVSKSGKRYGIIATYTLSSAQRKIDDINKGDWYYAVYDQRHNFKINAHYDINKRWTASANFQYHTGGRSTMPIAAFYAYGATMQIFTERNGYKMPDYHRLDLNLTYNFKNNDKRRVKHQLIFSIYNVYNRKNAYSVFTSGDNENLSDVKGHMLYLYQCVPSITWRITF